MKIETKFAINDVLYHAAFNEDKWYCPPFPEPVKSITYDGNNVVYNFGKGEWAFESETFSSREDCDKRVQELNKTEQLDDDGHD